jgi:predicted RNase H-like HicB family nuclease
MQDPLRSAEEIIFRVEEADEGGFVATAIGESIFTQADSLDEIRAAIREAVACHFGDASPPRLIRLHIVREEVL